MAIGACLLGVLAAAPAHAAGELDPAFGNGGKAVIANGGQARAMARDAQGNVYLAGDVFGTSSFDFTVAKLDRQGNPASGFGTNGTATVDIGTGSDDYGSAVAVDAAGNVYIAGDSNANGSYDLAVVKLDAAGHPVPVFGDGGKVLVDFGNRSDELGQAVVLDAAGNVFLVGSSDASGGYDFAIAKLDAGGALVAGYGDGGKVDVHVGGTYDFANAAVLGGGGTLFVGGSIEGTEASDMGVIALDATGRLVDAFGTGGKAIIDIAPTDYGVGLARDNEGSIYIAGLSLAAGGDADFAVARLSANGQPDESFGTGGARVVDAAAGASDYAQAVAVDGDRNVYLGGAASVAGKLQFAAVELDATGTPVASFGNAGVTFVDVSPNIDVAYAALLDGDGHLYLGGTANLTPAREASTQGSSIEFAAARLLLTPPDRIFRSGFDA